MVRHVKSFGYGLLSVTLFLLFLTVGTSWAIEVPTAVGLNAVASAAGAVMMGFFASLMLWRIGEGMSAIDERWRE